MRWWPRNHRHFLCCSVLSCALLLGSAAAVRATADATVSIRVDGTEQQFAVPPRVVVDRTFAHVRLAEHLGATVAWDGQNVLVTKGAQRLVITPGSRIAQGNDIPVDMGGTAFFDSDRVLVPVRFLATMLGYRVLWDGATNTVDLQTNAACRSGDPLDGVDDPERLKVVAPCASATGTAVRQWHQADGDIHIDLQVDAASANMLNAGNYNGMLVIEIVPDDQQKVQPPAMGAHVEVTGPYVLDSDHGWMEIHPVWHVREAP